jgi:23S rRNA pseudouridine1911/1915/1917 synthase
LLKKSPLKNMPKTIELLVPALDKEIRIDAWLASQITELSRSQIKKLIHNGSVLVDGKSFKGSKPARTGTKLQITIPDSKPTKLAPQNIPLNIIYEDNDIIVINKPAGLVVHPAPGHPDNTLVNALIYHCPTLSIDGEIRPGIVHRLDKDTSGVMVIAKHDRAMKILANQFKKRTVYKEYIAIVHGTPASPEGTIKTLIARHHTERKRMTAHTQEGREAITDYFLLKTFKNFSLVKLILHTGRTHQIRVHMSYINHPIVGDTQYGHKTRRNMPCAASRQLLHSALLKIRHPGTNEFCTYQAALPDDMRNFLACLVP